MSQEKLILDSFQMLPTEVRQISFRTARRFVESYHYLHDVPAIHQFSLGIYTPEGLVGVLIFVHPTARYEDQVDTIELARMCLYDSPKNSESKALSLAVKWIKAHTMYRRIISYADTAQGHKGTIYKAAGWNLVSISDNTGNIKNWMSRPNRRGLQGGKKLKFERLLRKKRGS